MNQDASLNPDAPEVPNLSVRSVTYRFTKGSRQQLVKLGLATERDFTGPTLTLPSDRPDTSSPEILPRRRVHPVGDNLYEVAERMTAAEVAEAHEEYARARSDELDRRLRILRMSAALHADAWQSIRLTADGMLLTVLVETLNLRSVYAYQFSDRVVRRASELIAQFRDLLQSEEPTIDQEKARKFIEQNGFTLEQIRQPSFWDFAPAEKPGNEDER